jgi:hypothetical protein
MTETPESLKRFGGIWLRLLSREGKKRLSDTNKETLRRFDDEEQKRDKDRKQEMEALVKLFSEKPDASQS